MLHVVDENTLQVEVGLAGNLASTFSNVTEQANIERLSSLSGAIILQEASDLTASGQGL